MSVFLDKVAGYFFKGGTAPTANQVWKWDNTNKYFAPGAATITPTAGTRAAALDTAYQPSTTGDTLVIASVQISSGAAGDGKIEAMTDASNPPTTVVGTFRVGTALTVIGGQLVFLVKASHYYKLTTTSTGGTPTFSVVGNVYELAL